MMEVPVLLRYVSKYLLLRPYRCHQFPEKYQYIIKYNAIKTVRMAEEVVLLPLKLQTGFDFTSGQPKTLKLVFTASLLNAQHQRDSVENKSARHEVVSL